MGSPALQSARQRQGKTNLNELHVSNKIPKIWLRSYGAFLTRREEESREGNGKEHEGLQGAEEGGGGREEEHERGRDAEVQERENNQDQLLQITCWNQDDKNIWWGF